MGERYGHWVVCEENDTSEQEGIYKGQPVKKQELEYISLSTQVLTTTTHNLEKTRVHEAVSLVDYS